MGTAPMSPAPPIALQGSYVVDSFVINGQARPPIPTDTVRWLRIDIEPYGKMTVARMDGSERAFRIAVDTVASRIIVGVGMPAVRGAARDRAPMSNSPFATGALAVTRPASNVLQLDGRVEDNVLSVRLHQLHEWEFPLSHKRPPDSH